MAATRADGEERLGYLKKEIHMDKGASAGLCGERERGRVRLCSRHARLARRYSLLFKAALAHTHTVCTHTRTHTDRFALSLEPTHIP